MAIKKQSPQNFQVEDLGQGNFVKQVFNAPANTHERLPCSIAPSGANTWNLTAENGVCSVDATVAAVQVNLPAAKGNNGLEITVKNRKGAHTVTVKPIGTDLIDDHASVPLTNRGDSATFVALDNDIETGWIVTSCCVDIS